MTPRFPADVRVDAAGRSPDADGATAQAGGATTPGASSPATQPRRSPAAAPRRRPRDLADAFVGRLVRVGGLVVDLRPDGFTLDDGTAIGRIVLRGAALELLPLIEPDDALNAIGRVEAATDGVVVVVDDPAASSWPAIRSRPAACPSPAEAASDRRRRLEP